MIHYTDRKNRINIITLDTLLAEDIYERLSSYPGMESVNLVRPEVKRSIISPESIFHSIKESTTAKVLIIDVRGITIPKLQRAYSEIVRFNRPDFNHLCFSVLIGDGPVNVFQENKNLDTFQNYLADMRVDYSPALFFSSPFFLYGYEEAQQMNAYENDKMPEMIPVRLMKYFKDENVSIKSLYKYFRAAMVPEAERGEKKKKREEKLKRLIAKIFADEFPHDVQYLKNGFTKEGHKFQGEPLRLNAYPFYFEEWILELLNKAQ